MVYGGQLDEPTARALAGKAQRVKYKNFGGAKRLVTFLGPLVLLPSIAENDCLQYRLGTTVLARNVNKRCRVYNRHGS
jgi:hypothetical protein